jgi:hypothetical protein
VRLLELSVESAHVVEKLKGQVEAHLLGRGLRAEFGHEGLSV